MHTVKFYKLKLVILQTRELSNFSKIDSATVGLEGFFSLLIDTPFQVQLGVYT